MGRWTVFSACTQTGLSRWKAEPKLFTPCPPWWPAAPLVAASHFRALPRMLPAGGPKAGWRQIKGNVTAELRFLHAQGLAMLRSDMKLPVRSWSTAVTRARLVSRSPRLVPPRPPSGRWMRASSESRLVPGAGGAAAAQGGLCAVAANAVQPAPPPGRLEGSPHPHPVLAAFDIRRASHSESLLEAAALQYNISIKPVGLGFDSLSAPARHPPTQARAIFTAIPPAPSPGPSP